MAKSTEQASEFHSSRIQDWPITERPRERLLEQGAVSLSLAELVAVILGTGSSSLSVIELSQRIIRLPLTTLTPSVLEGFTGMGPTKSARLLASIELGRRVFAQNGETPQKLSSSSSVVEFISPKLLGLSKEVFLAIAVDTKNRPVAVTEVARGGSDSVTLLPRDVFAEALRSGATGVICVHNHPSGDPHPSPEDRDLTRRLVEGARLLGIRFLDHVIYTSGAHFSFADAGLLT